MGLETCWAVRSVSLNCTNEALLARYLNWDKDGARSRVIIKDIQCQDKVLVLHVAHITLSFLPHAKDYINWEAQNPVCTLPPLCYNLNGRKPHYLLRL